MEAIRISDEIEYIEATDDPLSSDIGIIRTPRRTWLFDVGNDPSRLAELGGSYDVVLSHFHIDHVGNLDRLDIDRLYVSKFTLAHTHRGILTDREVYVDGLHIFPLPSSHSKGSLGLEVGDFAFVGDAIYSRGNVLYRSYNAQLLRAEIDTLSSLGAKYLLVSHHRGLLRERAEVIAELEQIYAKRDKNSPEILIKR